MVGEVGDLQDGGEVLVDRIKLRAGIGEHGEVTFGLRLPSGDPNLVHPVANLGAQFEFQRAFFDFFHRGSRLGVRPQRLLLVVLEGFHVRHEASCVLIQAHLGLFELGVEGNVLLNQGIECCRVLFEGRGRFLQFDQGRIGGDQVPGLAELLIHVGEGPLGGVEVPLVARERKRPYSQHGFQHDRLQLAADGCFRDVLQAQLPRVRVGGLHLHERNRAEQNADRDQAGKAERDPLTNGEGLHFVGTVVHP